MSVEELSSGPRAYLRGNAAAVASDGTVGRSSRITFANFATLQPDGTFNERGIPRALPADEFAQQLNNVLAFFVTEFRERFAATPATDLRGLSLGRLYNREN